MTGAAHFNEVFFTDARVPDHDRLGDVNDGWRVAQTTLLNERAHLSPEMALRNGGRLLERQRRDAPCLPSPACESWRGGSLPGGPAVPFPEKEADDERDHENRGAREQIDLGNVAGTPGSGERRPGSGHGK